MKCGRPSSGFGSDGTGVPRSDILNDARLERDDVLIGGRREGGGNWVRRSAVADPAALASLHRDAPQLADVADAPWARSKMGWWCDSTLRPSEFGDDPLNNLPI